MNQLGKELNTIIKHDKILVTLIMWIYVLGNLFAVLSLTLNQYKTFLLMTTILFGICGTLAIFTYVRHCALRKKARKWK